MNVLLLRLVDRDPRMCVSVFQQLFKKIFLKIAFWPRHMACGILIPRPGIEKYSF